MQADPRSERVKLFTVEVYTNADETLSVDLNTVEDMDINVVGGIMTAWLNNLATQLTKEQTNESTNNSSLGQDGIRQDGSTEDTDNYASGGERPELALPPKND